LLENPAQLSNKEIEARALQSYVPWYRRYLVS
jgi:hypothetical protein